MEENVVELELEYLTLLEEEELTVDELPKNLRDRIKTLNMSIAKFKKNPTDNLKEGIVKADVGIATDIDKWVDEQVEVYNAQKAKEAEELKKKSAPPTPPTPPTPPAPIEPTAEEKEAKRKADEEAEKERVKNEGNAKTAKIESDIKEKINAHPEKRISKEDLASIIGRQPEHPDRVGSLVLRRIFPLQFWRIE